jgi:hypothetical protein
MTIYATDVAATWLKVGLTIRTRLTFWSHAKNNWNISAQKLLKQGGRMTEEDEAFNDIERQAKQRKEAVKATLTNNAVIDREDRAYKSGWNSALELAAYEIEYKFKQAFGADTLSSMAIYIRGMKK